jgi:hypothetical protein
VNLQYGNESFVVTQPSEETITNGIIRVSRTTKKVVYFVEGFGQALTSAEDDPKGYAAAKLALQQENYEVKPLLLPSVEKILTTRASHHPRRRPAVHGHGDHRPDNYLRLAVTTVLVGPRRATRSWLRS